jgi:hypothetical protein
MPAPIPIQNTPSTPNAVYSPQIMLNTGIVNGKLVTSLQLTLAAAICDNAGTPDETWTPTGQSNTIMLPDLANLDPDLAAIQPQMDAALASVVSLLTALNAIRKIL